MKFLFENRPIEDKIVLGKICFDILSQPIEDKQFSQEYCGIWIDGRNRTLNSIEDLASIKSFYLYSARKYPMLVFCYNTDKFLEGLDISNLPIQIVKIDEINTHKGYSDFCKKELPFKIPIEYEKLLFLQTDSFLIKNGWEDYLNSIDVDYLGSPWLHTPMINIKDETGWNMIPRPIQVGNGAISFRRLSRMRQISELFSKHELREHGTLDKEPAEDLFYAFFIQFYGKLATVEEASRFCADPLTLEIYNNKSVFGGHFPVYKDRFKEKYLKISKT